MMRFLISLTVNLLIWIGLGKWGITQVYPELMASPYAGAVPMIMMWGGALTGLMIVLTFIIQSTGKE
ncbi:hypothetical protein P1A145kb_p081 [Pectobacterium phage DU_PP_I]|nr:hypothetical protein P1A145kb_p081 [Pectobacterium phage DU_PP_I]ATS93798.1 hypothetical protein P12B145kb_p082 [Pectobacterium phage DU_PP_IV]